MYTVSLIYLERGLYLENKLLSLSYKKQNSSNPFGDTSIEAGTRLVDRMMKERWEEVIITSTELILNSRNVCKTMKNLSNDPTTSTPLCLVNSNYSSTAKAPCRVCTVLPTDPTGQEVTLVYLFPEKEYRKGITAQTNG